jgi:hypothetical protein
MVAFYSSGMRLAACDAGRLRLLVRPFMPDRSGPLLHAKRAVRSGPPWMTSAYPDIKSCAAALQRELEANDKPGVYSVSGRCTLLKPKR